MAKVQITTYHGSCYCEICLCLAVVKVNPSVTGTLTSIYIYNAFIKLGLWSKKQQRSEVLGDSPGLKGQQHVPRSRLGLAVGAQCHPAVSLLTVGSETAGSSMGFMGDLCISASSCAPRAGL